MTTNKLVIISVTVKKKNGGMANQQFNTNIDAAGDWSKVISVTGVVLEDDDTVEVTAGHAPVGAIKQGKWTVKTPPPAPTP